MENETESKAPVMDHQAILACATHRFPFLMVDRILEARDGGKTIIGLKNVTFNEPWAQGHFPDFPIFPGVLQIETMAQVGGILIIGRPENENNVGLLTAVDNAKFRRPVNPGDQLMVEATIVKERHSIVILDCKCSVDGQVVSQATIKFAIVPKQ